LPPKLASREMASPAKQTRARISQDELWGWLEQSRIIPSIRIGENIPTACASPAKIVFLMFGTPVTIGDLVTQLKDSGKFPIVNIDLLSGFARDAAAIEFLAKSGAPGVISTHQDTLRAARSQGLLVVQRTFAIDSVAVANSFRTLEHFLPDIIELLPAIAAPLIIPMLRPIRPRLPVIGCGLVSSLMQVDELVRQGVASVSASNPSLWIV
jgi:glycerol uptake operon antiterminator